MFKPVEELSGAEVVTEAERLAGYAQDCREIGGGVNSKETMRFNACMGRIEAKKLTDAFTIVSIKERWDDRLRPFHDLHLRLTKSGVTLEEMGKLFGLRRENT